MYTFSLELGVLLSFFKLKFRLKYVSIVLIKNGFYELLGSGIKLIYT